MEAHGRYILRTGHLTLIQTHARQRSHLFLRKETAVRAGEVHLVTILLVFDAAHDRLKLRQFNLCDTNQLIHHLLMLHAELLLIRDHLPLTSATRAKMLAERLLTTLTILDEALHLSFHITVLLAEHLQVDHIARNGERHKNNHIIYTRYGLSISSVICYCDIL